MHRFISWWWRMHMCSCFRICWNTSSERWVWLSESIYSVSSPECCLVVICVCLISSRAAVSFSSWLQATHTNVAYRLGKPKPMNSAKRNAMACVRQKIRLFLFKELLWSFRKRKFIIDFLDSTDLLRKPFYMGNPVLFEIRDRNNFNIAHHKFF